MTKPALVVAVLKRWQFSGDRTIRGYVSNSTDPILSDGDFHSIVNFQHMTHFPRNAHIEKEYWLVFTQSRRYFKVFKEDQVQPMPDS